MRLQSPPPPALRFARGILFRRGEAEDLDELCAVDTDAAVLFEQAGLELNLPDDHEFAVAERDRWQRSLAAGTTLVATDLRGRMVGFAAVGSRDGEAFIDQLSVRRSYMRRGIGTTLLHAAIQGASDGSAAALWLTTYDHLAWNRPFYQRNGFSRVSEHDCGGELRGALDFERRWLPRPEQRVAMRRPLA